MKKYTLNFEASEYKFFMEEYKKYVQATEKRNAEEIKNFKDWIEHMIILGIVHESL